MTLETLRLDSRGVSEVIGSILVFGLVVALISMLQVQAVPNANQEVEMEHNNQLQGDMARLSESVTRTSARGSGESVSVALGTSYPPRLLFFNPPSPNGRLQTTAPAELTVENARATDGETADYVSGDPITLETSSITYQPNYNMYEDAPVSTYDNTVLFNQFENATIVQNRGTLVDGKRISLVTVEDSLSEETTETVSLSTAPISAPARTVPVTNDGSSSITVTIPTRLSESVWVEEVLAAELDDPDGGANGAGVEAGDRCSDMDATQFDDNDRYVVDCSYTPGSAVSGLSEDMALLTLTFEQDVTYELETSRVGFGDTAPQTGPMYVTTVAGQSSGVPELGAQRLVVEVRDEYNNPVVGERVTFSAPSSNGSLRNDTGATGQELNVTTNADGQAAITYIAPSVNSPQTYQIGASMNGSVIGTGSFDADTQGDAAFSVNVNDVGSVPTGTPPNVSIDRVEGRLATGNVIENLLGNESDAVFDVEWSTDDAPGETLESAELQLINEDTHKVVDTARYDLSGEPDAEKETRLRETDSGAGDTYTVRLIVTDNGGYRVSKEDTGNSPT